MITVWSVLWGDKYSPAYVYALREMVAKYLTVPHQFKCLTDHNLPGIDTVKPQKGWPGWWGKLELFDVADGPSLYFDLDVVITGDIDYLVYYTRHEFAAPENWALSGHGGIQSSVMAWNGEWKLPALLFDYDRDHERLWGDQEFLWELRSDNWVRIGSVGSYKYHCAHGKPDWMRIIVFHGKPDPHEVTGWLLSYTQTLRWLISETTQNGLTQALQSMGLDCMSQPTLTDQQTSTLYPARTMQSAVG